MIELLEYSDSQPRDDHGMWMGEGHAHIRQGQAHRVLGQHDKAAEEFAKASEKYAKAGAHVESKTAADMSRRSKQTAAADKAKMIRRMS